MTDKKDTLRTFLIIVIVLILCAMGIYGFIMWPRIQQKLAELNQKESQVERHERNTVAGQMLEDKDPKKEEAATPTKSVAESSKSTLPVIKEETSKLPESNYNSENDPPLLQNKEMKDGEMKSSSKIKIKDSMADSEFEEKALSFKKGKHKKHYKRHHRWKRGMKKHSGVSLERRIARLEKKIGVKSKKSRLSERVRRLEKAVYKKK